MDKILDVVIIGGGIAGLATYHFLKKYLGDNVAITIYETYEHRSKLQNLEDVSFTDLSASSALVGGGLGVASNGIRVLEALNPVVRDAVVAQGYQCEKMTINAARGYNLVTMDNPGGKNRQVASSRQGIWECLRRGVPDEAIVNRKVSKALSRTENEFSKGSAIVLPDGTQQAADLVIGADGVWSKVREALFDNKFPAQYTNLVGVGGFLDMELPKELKKAKGFVFTMGGNGFFGYGPLRPLEEHKLMWWSTWETSDAPSKEDLDTEKIKEAIKERHGSWKDPAIQEILKNIKVESIYPTWTVPTLPHWGKDGLVLVGDAAHALQPTSGQGVSQVLEDSQMLPMLLAHFLKTNDKDKAVDLATKKFYDLRHERVSQIKTESDRMAGGKKSLSYPAEMMMYGFLGLTGTALGKRLFWERAQKVTEYSVDEEVMKALPDLKS